MGVFCIKCDNIKCEMILTVAVIQYKTKNLKNYIDKLDLLNTIILSHSSNILLFICIIFKFYVVKYHVKKTRFRVFSSSHRSQVKQWRFSVF